MSAHAGEPAGVSDRPDGRRRWTRRPRLDGPWLAIAAIAVLGTGLRALIPPLLRWGNQHDDFAQVRSAAALLDGRWLGEWGTAMVPHITLAKGPGYPLFLAAIHPTGLPPQLASYLIYLAGALLVARVLGRRLGQWWGVGLFGALTFNPVVFSSLFSIVYRDALNTALALVALGLGLDLASRVTRRGRWGWLTRALVAAEVLLLGAVLGWVMITRADVVWILFAVTGAFVVHVLADLRALGRRGWTVSVAGALVVAVVASAVPAAVAAENQRVYGVHLVDDYSDGTFADAVTLWSSVQAPDSSRFENVSEAQRAAVYAVSPTARSLENDLETLGGTWITRNCTWHEDTMSACDDYGSYFTWALRDAAVRTGGVTTAQEFQELFGRLAAEIAAACDAGTLSCGMRGLSPDVPPLDRIPLRVVVANVLGTVNGALAYNSAAGQAQQAPGAGAEIATWRSAVNGTDPVLAAVAAGQHPVVLSQTALLQLLTLIYRAVTIVALVLAGVALFLRRTWTTATGRTAIVLLCAWLGNLLIVGVFHAGTNRSFGTSKMPLYTMSSQSFFMIGVALAATITVSVAWSRLRSALSSPAGAPSTDAADVRDRRDDEPAQQTEAGSTA